MSDIVRRLRDPSAFPDTVRADCAEAADEIERLRDALERMRHDRDLILNMHERAAYGTVRSE